MINYMLNDILKNKKCFKLILGAGNSDIEEIEKLVYTYSLAGANLFDLNASIEVVNAAKKALLRSEIKKDRYLCVSVGLYGDPHLNKAFIDNSKCIRCKLCEKICPQSAIKNNEVISKKCIGCQRCFNVCKNEAIFLKSEYREISEILPPVIEQGIDCIEFHAINEDEKKVEKIWNEINSIYKGNLSICLDRSTLGNKAFINRVKKLISNKKNITIQADGAPMSGGCDDFKTTLQSVATAELVQSANLDCFVLLSGGTNSKSTELARLCNVDINGVAIGSYARKIVKKYIEHEDFFENKKLINSALACAKELVDKSLSFL